MPEQVQPPHLGQCRTPFARAGSAASQLLESLSRDHQLVHLACSFRLENDSEQRRRDPRSLRWGRATIFDSHEVQIDVG
jgi:hypothetical protein